MPENYIRLDNGEMIPDRRNLPMDTQQTQVTLLKILSKVETIEINNEIKLSGITDKIENLNDKLVGKLKVLEEKFEEHVKEEENITSLLGQHDEKLETAEKYVTRIHQLEAVAKRHEIKIVALEKLLEGHVDAPKQMIYDTVMKIAKKLGWFVVFAMGVAILFSIANPNFWSLLFNKATGG